MSDEEGCTVSASLTNPNATCVWRSGGPQGIEDIVASLVVRTTCRSCSHHEDAAYGRWGPKRDNPCVDIAGYRETLPIQHGQRVLPSDQPVQYPWRYHCRLPVRHRGSSDMSLSLKAWVLGDQKLANDDRLA
jgi:hypothetical protein